MLRDSRVCSAAKKLPKNDGAGGPGGSAGQGRRLDRAEDANKAASSCCKWSRKSLGRTERHYDKITNLKSSVSLFSVEKGLFFFLLNFFRWFINDFYISPSLFPLLREYKLQHLSNHSPFLFVVIVSEGGGDIPFAKYEKNGPIILYDWKKLIFMSPDTPQLCDGSLILSLL